MVTMVGMQGDFSSAVKDLIELEYDTVEAYEAALNRLDNESYKKKLQEFLGDHRRHIQEFSNLLRTHEEEAPTGPSVGKQWITKGKVVLASMVGDKTILSAMSSNEIDTNTAYERIQEFKDIWDDAHDLIDRAFEDEKRHKAWLDAEIKVS